MSSKVPPAAIPTTVVADDPEDRKGRLKNIGGSQSDQWNNLLANQAIQGCNSGKALVIGAARAWGGRGGCCRMGRWVCDMSAPPGWRIGVHHLNCCAITDPQVLISAGNCCYRCSKVHGWAKHMGNPGY